MTWTPRVGMKVRCLVPDLSHDWPGINTWSTYKITHVWSNGEIILDDNCGGEITMAREDFEPVSELSDWNGLLKDYFTYEELGEIDAAAKADVYEHLGAEIGRLVTEKQKAYGSSFQKSGDVMRSLYPNGISPEQMDDALAIVRVVDKLYRIATDKDAFGESPWKDIVGYGLLGAAKGGGTNE